MSAISVTHLCKSFGRVRAVDDLSFTVQAGCVTGFLGPNGAGKTTTMRMILGLVTPDSGTATVGDHAYVELPSPIRTVGAVLEATAFHPGRTARVHLLALCVAAGLSPDRVDQVLAEVDLAHAGNRRLNGFSLGMRQRLALACALLGDPTVLVLDEPANGLDPEGIHWLREFLRVRAAAGHAVFVSSHVLAEVAACADRVIIISNGRLVADSVVDELPGGRSGLEDAYLELVRGIR